LYWDQTTLPGGGGAENVFVHNFVTHTDVDVLQRSALDRAPAWSPDETKIAFQSNSAESPSLWLMNADGTNARQIPHQPSGFNYSPKFSPDGTKLIFMNDPRVAGPSGWPMRLYVMGVDGTGLTPVGPADRFSSDASFSPDGTKILYSSRPASGPDDGSTGVYVMNADGSNPVLIVHGDYSGAAWQPVPSPNANVAPHAYGSAKNKAPLALFGDGSLSYDEDGWILRYEWRWGDNTPMTANKYAWHKYAAPGTYLVRLTVFDNNGAASTKKAWITVN
jgi:Tol biopolymer transport system component